MHKSLSLGRLLSAPPSLRATLNPVLSRSFSSALPRHYASPSVAQKSFWVSLIPKPLRSTSPTSAIGRKAKSKEWNPATFFIIIFLLIGSMSIQMIALRNEFAAFMRRADARIGLLKEIIERIQKGEDVDVEGLLGTGDKEREKEWEEVLREIEEEDEVWERSQKNKVNHEQATEVDTMHKSKSSNAEPGKKGSKQKSNAPAGFY